MKQTYTVAGLAAKDGGAVELTLSSEWERSKMIERHCCTLIAPQEFARRLHVGTRVVLSVSEKEE